MRGSMLAAAVIVAAATFATTASAQAPASAPAQAPAAPQATGPAYSMRFFTTPLENDPSRVVQMQMQLHLPNRPGNGFHTHNGDQWESVIEGEITFTARSRACSRPGTSSTSHAERSTATRTRAIGRPAPSNS
jgi:hypothetical protein